jgi:hypothetical protein
MTETAGGKPSGRLFPNAQQPDRVCSQRTAGNNARARRSRKEGALMSDLIGQKRSLKDRAVDEVKKAILITLYLWVLLAVFALHRTIILEQHDINATEQGFAIVNALVLAKIILVADGLNLGHHFAKSPLAYSVLWKSFLFGCLLVVFHIIENVISGMLKGQPAIQGLDEVSGGSLRGVLWLGVMAFVSLIPFFSFREVARVIGSGPLWDLFFRRGSKRFSLHVEV